MTMAANIPCTQHSMRLRGGQCGECVCTAATTDAAPGSRLRVCAHDERGASILIALFYFLVCAVVGGVVLTAATVTSGQLANLQTSQQSYYATSSAAELLRDAIEGGTCTSSGADATAEWTCELPASKNNTLAGWLKSMVEKASGSTKTASATYTIRFSATGANAVAITDNVPDVAAKITMNSDYSLHIELGPPDDGTGDAGTGFYRMTLDIPASLLHRTDDSVERITWGHAVIGKAFTGEGE